MFIQLALVVGIAVVVGLIYNLATGSADNHLGLTVPEGRYANALNCPKPSEAVEKAVPSVVKEPSPSEPDTSPAKLPEKSPVDEPEKTGNSDPAVSDPGETPAAGKTPRILIDEAFEEWEVGTLFIDARRTKEYVKGHIPGAISISPWEKGREEKVARLAGTEPQAAPVVVYCTRSKDCEDSEEISSNLRQVGFENVLVFQGGFPVWQEKKKPVVEGEEPGERPGQ
ncbi:MAG: rhodanese-like domain-containing protein [Planctomycetota bacterium]|nr:rhodanese-like domain-containing protein [Planctomycetota bacterium]MEC9032739.1 rhodanese-like domain-containing protein [Planctomycetota bacterium]